jgi:hypothetical protein
MPLAAVYNARIMVLLVLNQIFGRSSVAILLNSVWKTVRAFCIISA